MANEIIICFVRLLICSLFMISVVAGRSSNNVNNNNNLNGNNEDPNNNHLAADPETILKYLEEEDIDAAYDALNARFFTSERNPDPEKVQHALSKRKIRRGGGLDFTTQYKLMADLEQAQYLLKVLQEENPAKAAFFADTVIPVYEKVLSRIPPLEQLERTHGLYQFQETDANDGIFNVYNKALHFPEVDEFDGSGNPISIFSDSLDSSQIEKQWREKGIVAVDNLLSDEALHRIRKVLLESTVWYQTKLPKKFGGYSGAYVDDGLHQRIILQFAIELRKKLPQIFQSHPLKYLWAYKYDSDFKGINLHADEAAINVNIWITPEEANLDKESGGLVIFTVKPPEQWDVNQYNRDTDVVYEQLLKPTNFANVTVPYRENRAVLFDSALFHQTDNFKFKKGYTNRRINLTLLYGEMSQKAAERKDQQGEL